MNRGYYLPNDEKRIRLVTSSDYVLWSFREEIASFNSSNTVYGDRYSLAHKEQFYADSSYEAVQLMMIYTGEEDVPGVITFIDDEVEISTVLHLTL